MKFQDKLRKLFDYQKFEGDPKLNQTIKDSLREESSFVREKYMNLKENELGSVVGGTPDGGNLEGAPASFLYKAEVKFSGYFCKCLPSDDADNVCALDQYALVYVIEVIDGNKYVKCQFKGNSHREEGYIRSDILQVIQ